MKEIIINNENIDINSTFDKCIRVKALMINDKNEILLGYSFGEYQLIGGHVNDDEDLFEALKREIKEETGIILEEEYINPFLVIKHYSSNYRNTGKNRCNIIYYFIINNNKEIDVNNTNYDLWEEKGKYKVKKVNMDDLEKILIDNISNSDLNKLIVEEMLYVIREYNFIKQGSNI